LEVIYSASVSRQEVIWYQMVLEDVDWKFEERVAVVWGKLLSEISPTFHEKIKNGGVLG